MLGRHVGDAGDVIDPADIRGTGRGHDSKDAVPTVLATARRRRRRSAVARHAAALVAGDLDDVDVHHHAQGVFDRRVRLAR